MALVISPSEIDVSRIQPPGAKEAPGHAPEPGKVHARSAYPAAWGLTTVLRHPRQTGVAQLGQR